jgi:hypothetical protein
VRNLGVRLGHCEQSPCRQRFEHRPSVGVIVGGYLSDRCPTSYRLTTLAGLGQPEQGPPCDGLLPRGQSFVRRLGEARDGCADSAYLPVAREGQSAAVAPLPQRQQCGGHQR